MNPNQLLSQVKTDLLTSHDIHNTQIRLYQLSKNPELLLSEGQRGALNFYSSLQDVDESTLIRLIEAIQIPTSLDNHIQTINTNVEPIVKSLTRGTFKWYVMSQESVFSKHSTLTSHIMEIDSSEYKSATEAQEKADQFIVGLNEGDAKHWIRLAIVQLANTPDVVFMNTCQAIVLKIHSNYYAMVTQKMDEPLTKERQDQKTVHFTNKILTTESVIDPVWVTRGFISQSSPPDQHGVYYILFKIKQTNQIPILAKNLQLLLC